MDFYQRVVQNRLIVIVRKVPKDKATKLFSALYDGGARLIEITMNSPDATEIIMMLRKKYEGRCMIGAGTVTDVHRAKMALKAGAEFLISPNLDGEVIRIADENQIGIIPGVMTPSEVCRAKELGAKMVKLFPIQSLGTDYVKEIKGPLDHIPIVAVGGVSIKDVPKYMSVGVTAVGIGSDLVNHEYIENDQFDLITENVKRVIKILKESENI